MESIDPVTGLVIARYAAHSPKEVSDIVERAHDRFAAWRRSSFAERSRALHRLGDLLDEHTEDLAGLMAAEMGKPLREGRAEIAKSAWVCRYYADGAEQILADRNVPTEFRIARVHHEPLGVVLGVMPWNFPFWQVVRFAAPTLMAGNTVVLKHASNVTGVSRRLEDLFAAADFSTGCFASIVIPGDRVVEVIAHPHVRAVSVTGSEAAGRAVAAAAGSHLKKTVLELGGSDPSVVFPDADVASAAASCAAGRLLNAGQSCIAAKRFVIHSDVYDDWLALFTEHLEHAVIGPPLEESTTLGPLARRDLRDDLHRQVERAIEGGARLHLGGRRPTETTSAFYSPTILTDVALPNPALEEELFGPVAAVVRVSSETDAIEMANRTTFGLGAALYTSDVERGLALAASSLHAGTVSVNAPVASDPRLPFGGVKSSGYGRELGPDGLFEFVNVKTIVAA